VGGRGYRLKVVVFFELSLHRSLRTLQINAMYRRKKNCGGCRREIRITKRANAKLLSDNGPGYIARELQQHYYCPQELKWAISQFVDYYNNHRYPESLKNLTPNAVSFGKEDKILKKSRTKSIFSKRAQKNFKKQFIV